MALRIPRLRITIMLAMSLMVPTVCTACSTPTSPVSQQHPTPAAAAPVVWDNNLPFDTLPTVPNGRAAHEPCPYIDTTWLENTNGQRITGYGIDTRFDTPACIFWSYPEESQATIIVRHMPSPQAATEVVDWAAPISSTEPVENGEWSGGRRGTPEGALYAVQKGNYAVVVFTNQPQSLKAELIGKEVIKNTRL